MNHRLINKILDTTIILLVSFLVLAQSNVIKVLADESKVIEIKTIQDLAGINNNLSADYVLMNDLDLTVATSQEGETFYNKGRGWDPIGSLSNPFKGKFDGNGFTISGLTISRSKNYLGLFAATSSATIKNVLLKDVDVTGENNVGSLIGDSRATKIFNISVSGTVSGHMYTGGIVGYVLAGTEVNHVFSKASVVGGNQSIGGIIGRMGRDSILNNAHSMAHVTTTKCSDNLFSDCAVGGVVGQMDDISKRVTSVFFNGQLTNQSNNKLNEKTIKYYAKPVIGSKKGGSTSNLYYHLDYL